MIHGIPKSFTKTKAETYDASALYQGSLDFDKSLYWQFSGKRGCGKVIYVKLKYCIIKYEKLGQNGRYFKIL